MTPIIDPIELIDKLQALLAKLYKSIPWYIRWIAKTLYTDAQKALQQLEDYINSQKK